MDYVQSLREERTSAHSVFHTVILGLANLDDSTYLVFFEGEEDPSFYLTHLRAKGGSKKCNSYICSGRAEVLKVLRLLEVDGRVISRSLFFIDKDHSDLVEKTVVNHSQLFQTEYYSIENYLVNHEMFLIFWIEILHLDANDERRRKYLAQFDKIYARFVKRMQTLMAIVLLGRGIDGHPSRKLNLNNIKLDLMFEINFEKEICCYKSGAGQHFAEASNMIEDQTNTMFFNKRKVIKAIINTHLKSKESKVFIRGKYELWFFVKFIQNISVTLSSKTEAKRTKCKRATPNIQLSHSTALEILAPRLPCPDRLSFFINEFFDKFPDTNNVGSFTLS